MTVALSRARLGLYVLGRRETFEACHELRPAFDVLLQKPDKLMLTTGEMWPSQRVLADEESQETVEGEVAMEGVEHLGQYVFEMTKTKMKQMQADKSTIPAAAQEPAEPTIPEEEGEGEDGEADGTYYKEQGEEGEQNVEEQGE